MAVDRTLIELDAEATKNLNDLMFKFGETRPDDMIAKALGLLHEVGKFLHDGRLTIVDPSVPADRDSEDREVDLVFENAPSGSS